MSEVNEATVNEVKATLESPGKPKSKGAKKVAKKVKKAEEETTGKKGKKVKSNGISGSGKTSNEDGLVSIADLAAEADISPQSARVKLRAAELDRGEGRWKWEPGSKQLKAARKVLGLEG